MATNSKNEKALSLMLGSKTTKERASNYFSRIKEGLYHSKIKSFEERINKKKDEIFDLENISLETNKNKGIKEFTKEELEKRFSDIIDLRAEITIDELELKSMKAAFEDYFGKIK